MQAMKCIWPLAGLAAAGLLIGCGSTQFGADARVPVEARHLIRAGVPAGAALSLPGERGYNIHIKQSSQNLGATGEAVGRCDATAQGTALAEATASKGGSAKADFKIGHRIDNASGRAQTMAARVRFNLQHSVSASDAPAPATFAKADLVLVVIDSRKRAVSKSMVAQLNSDESQGTADLPQQRDITVHLEPDESYDLVLFGQVEAASADGQTASARIEMDRLEMDLTFAPVTTQPAAQASRD